MAHQTHKRDKIAVGLRRSSLKNLGFRPFLGLLRAPASRRGLLFGLLAVVASLFMFRLRLPTIAKGIDSLTWNRIPATPVTAYFHREYDPIAARKLDGSFHKEWSGLLLAYSTSDGESYSTEHFDTVGMTLPMEPFLRPIPPRVRHIMNLGQSVEVRVNPRVPQEAVVQPGVPFTAGVALFLPASLF